MHAAELTSVLGAPAEERRFVEDRVSYEILLAGPPIYRVSCTILDRGGLTYLVVMAPTMEFGA